MALCRVPGRPGFRHPCCEATRPGAADVGDATWQVAAHTRWVTSLARENRDSTEAGGFQLLDIGRESSVGVLMECGIGRPAWLVRALAALLLAVALAPAGVRLPSQWPRTIVSGPAEAGEDLRLPESGSEPRNPCFRDRRYQLAPLVGSVQIGGLSVAGAEKAIADSLRKGGFLLQPQVLVLQQVRGAQVSVLGQVARPGRYPLRKHTMKLTDALALAGGANPQAGDKVILTGMYSVAAGCAPRSMCGRALRYMDAGEGRADPGW